MVAVASAFAAARCGGGTKQEVKAQAPQPFFQPFFAKPVTPTFVSCEQLRTGQYPERDIGACYVQGGRQIACTIAIQLCGHPPLRSSCNELCEQRTKCCDNLCDLCVSIENLPCSDCNKLPALPSDAGIFSAVGVIPDASVTADQ